MSELAFNPDLHPVFWVQSGQELCSRINFLFARKYLARTVLRLTGGCGKMCEADSGKLRILREALEGFNGVGLFGGTSVRRLDQPTQVLDTVLEVIPSIKSTMLKIGVVAKCSDIRNTPFGLMTNVNKENGTCTVLTTSGDAILLTQPSADRHAQWTDEYKECLRIVEALTAQGWRSLLVVFNGGSVTEQEFLAWAKLGQLDPERWPILLIRGSGRIADHYANDQSWLVQHPSVHVAECDTQALREKLGQLHFFRKD